MTGHVRVRIPWTVRLNRFRRHVLPLLGFATCMVLTTWLWDRQGSLPNAVGEVEADEGHVEWGYETRPGYFSQDHNEVAKGSKQSVEAWRVPTLAKGSLEDFLADAGFGAEAPEA